MRRFSSKSLKSRDNDIDLYERSAKQKQKNADSAENAAEDKPAAGGNPEDAEADSAEPPAENRKLQKEAKKVENFPKPRAGRKMMRRQTGTFRKRRPKLGKKYVGGWSTDSKCHRARTGLQKWSLRSSMVSPNI